MIADVGFCRLPQIPSNSPSPSPKDEQVIIRGCEGLVMRGFRRWSLGLICVAGLMSGCVTSHTSIPFPDSKTEHPKYLNVTRRCVLLFTTMGTLFGLYSGSRTSAGALNGAIPGAIGGAFADWVRCGMSPFEIPVINIGFGRQMDLRRQYAEGSGARKRQGIATEWYDNGQKMSEGKYKDGKRIGKWT